MSSTKPAAGQVWEGRSKPGYPVSRRRVVEVLPTGVQWEPVGWGSKNAKPVVALSTWNSWAYRLVKQQRTRGPVPPWNEENKGV